MTERRDGEFRLEEIGRGAVGWLLGLGLLRFHLVVFALGAVGLLLLNLYRSPDELRATDTLRVWAILLVCHAVALATGWSTWRAVRPDRPPPTTAPATSGDSAPVATPVPVAPHPATWASNGAVANGHVPVAELNGAGDPAYRAPAPPIGQPPALALPPRGRFSPPPSEPPPVGHPGLTGGTVDAATAKLRAVTAEAVAAGRTGWLRLAEATRAGMTAIKTRLSGADEAPAAGPAAQPPATPVPLPDAGAPLPPPGWSAALAAPNVPPGWGTVVHPPVSPAPAAHPTAPAPHPSGHPPAPAPVVAGETARDLPGTHAAGPGTEGPPLKAETEWTWMEAAAAAWLARRVAEEPGSAPPGTGPTPEGGTPQTASPPSAGPAGPPRA